MGKAYTMDEPLFLAPALHILKDPLHPLAFSFNWYGQTVPMSSINNTPPLFLYLLALAWKCTGGRPFAMRLFFLPLDLLAAVSLFLLASRFLKKPLVPTLVALATPGFLVGLNLLYPDKAAAAFGFFGLYAWVRGIDEDKSGWTYAALGALAMALLSKYLAVVFLVPAAAYAAARRKPVAKMMLPAAALAPVGLYLAVNLLHGGAAFSSAWRTTAQSLGAASWARRWRAVLAGVGGCCAAAALWPFFAGRPRWKPAAAALAAAFLLFLPLWDAGGPAPDLLARMMGIAMAFAALYGLARILERRTRSSEDILWLSWAGAVLLMEAFAYWSVMARVTALLVPPLIFAWAGMLERTLEQKPRAALYALSLAATLALSLSLAWVDSCYADAQAQAARVAAALPAKGGRLWTTSHWGLQYYVEREGGRELDALRGGWSQVRPGDAVVWSRVNSNQLPPNRRFLINAKQIDWANPLPLRLMSARGDEAGFYSSVFGFLPYALSRAPLDEFFFARILPRGRAY